MSYYADDIRRIAKQKEDNEGLGDPKERAIILGISEDMSYTTEDEHDFTLTPPLTLTILTYDDAQDVTIEANNGDFLIKTAETAIIIDDRGQEFEIDEIIYTTPP